MRTTFLKFIAASILLPNLAFAADTFEGKVGEIGRCAVRTLRSPLAMANEARELTEIIDKARAARNSSELDSLLGDCVKVESRLKAIGKENSTEARNRFDRSIISNGTASGFFAGMMDWIFPLEIRLEERKQKFDGAISSAQASDQTKKIVRSFYVTSHWCGQASGNVLASFIQVAGKVAASVCQSTSGDRWLEVAVGGGFAIGGIGSAHIGGGEFRGQGTGSLFQVNRSLLQGRSIITSGAAERTCTSDEACEFGNLSDVMYRDNTMKQEMIGVGLGYAPLGESAKIYNLRLKILPLGVAQEMLGRYILNGEF